jgi:MoaA/NifB/PqqE/SkfB family radical SAM enzyme
MPVKLEEINRLPYPKQIILDVHSYCNARCTICPYDSLKGKNPMGVMEVGLFEKIIDDFANLAEANSFKGKVLLCNMGDPFFRADVIDRIKYIIRSGLEFNIQTNAYLLSPELTDRLVESGFNGHILISIHGISPKIYKEIMGLDIHRTLANVDYLIEHYPKDKISVQAIPYHWPRGEARRVRKYWRDRRISVRMPLPNNRAGLLPAIKDVPKKSLVACTQNRPLGEMVICFNGDVILCCNDMAQQEIVGNLRGKTIQEVWNGDGFVTKVRQIYCGASSSEGFICKTCEFGKMSKSPVRRLIKNIQYSLRRFFFVHVW